MATHADIVMPKLGLTMTEGMVAQWAIAPGQSFTPDQTVALIETDKIAYELPAPGAGTLAEILVQKGTTVAVGTPIALWVPKSGPAKIQSANVVNKSAFPAAASSVSTAPEPPRAANRGPRIIATPLARRRARQAGIEIAAVTASNGHRIRAADVEAAVARRGPASPPKRPTPDAAVAALPDSAAPWFSLVETQAGVDRLLRLLAEISDAMPGLRAALIHFAVLAAARALAEQDVVPMISLQRGSSPLHVFDREACRCLSTIVACDRADADTVLAATTLAVIESAGMTKVARAPSPTCGVTLGVGAVNPAIRLDEQGAAAARAELTLTLCLGQNVGALDPGKFLGRVCFFLENPVALLAM